MSKERGEMGKRRTHIIATRQILQTLFQKATLHGDQGLHTYKLLFLLAFARYQLISFMQAV